jgi:hypothetical protein
MKAFWKIIGFTFLGIVILLILAIVGGLFFLRSFDIKKYKPQIIQSATQALGRAVDFKDIKLEVSLDKGVRLNLGDLTIAEAPEFGSGNFVTVKQIDAGVDILAYVFARQVSVPSVVINSPQFTIIRDEKGVLSISTIGQSAGSSTKQTAANPAAALPAIFINSFKIENAQLTLVDKTVAPELTLAVSQLSLDVQRFSLTNPFDILLEAAMLSPQKNFRLEGKAQLRLDNKEVKLSEMGITLKLGQLPLQTLRSFPMLAGVPFPQLLDGELKLRIKEAAISDKGLEKILADASLNGGKIIAPDIVPGISLEAKQIDFNAENLSLDGVTPAKVSFKAAVYQDNVNVDFGANVIVDLKTMNVQVSQGQFATDLAFWPIKKIKAQIASLKDVPLPENLTGKIQATIKELSLTPAGLKNILVDMKLEGGAVDLGALAPAGIPAAVTKTDLTISNFSLGKQFAVIFKTAYLTDVQNLSFDGIIALDPATQAMQIKNGIAGIDLNNFPLDKIKSSPLIPAGIPFPKTLGGRLVLQVHDMAASAKGLDSIDVTCKWQSGKIAIDEVAPGISVAANQINLELQNFSLTQPFRIKGSLGYESNDPNIFIDGQVKYDLTTQKVDLKDLLVTADLSKLPFDQIKSQVAPIKEVKLPQVFKGELAVTVKELSVGPQGLGAMLLDLGLKNGEVEMSEVAPGVSVAAHQIGAAVKNFSLGKPFTVDINLGYLSAVPNIHIDGDVDLNLTDQSVALSNSHVAVDLSKISFEQLKGSVAALKDVSLPESLKGQLNITITNAAAGAAGLKSLASEVTLKDWEAKLKELTVPISGAETKFKVTESQLTADDLRFNVGRGQIISKVNVADYMTRQAFDFSTEIKDLNLAEVLEQSKAPVKIEGVVFATMKAQGQGADLNSITGEGNLEVKEVKLKNLNILKTVLDKVSIISDISRIKAKLPEKYLAKLEDADTTINKVSSTMSISAGQLVLSPVAVEADEFVFSGTGQAKFDQTYNFDGSFKITPELSAIMGSSTEEFQYLYDSDNLISLPIHVDGKGAQAPTISVLESAFDLMKNAGRTQVKKEIKRALSKVLGGSVEAQPQDQDSPADGTQSVPQEDPGSKIIGDIFDKVFK